MINKVGGLPAEWEDRQDAQAAIQKCGRPRSWAPKRTLAWAINEELKRHRNHRRHPRRRVSKPGRDQARRGHRHRGLRGDAALGAIHEDRSRRYRHYQELLAQLRARPVKRPARGRAHKSADDAVRPAPMR
jgi:hypothetical protein